MTEKKLFFGLKKSPVDTHEKILSFTYEKVQLPTKFSLRDQVKYIFDQGHMNSCSANAVSNQIMLSDHKGLVNVIPSRLYIYYNSRMIDNGSDKYSRKRQWSFIKGSIPKLDEI